MTDVSLSDLNTKGARLSVHPCKNPNCDNTVNKKNSYCRECKERRKPYPKNCFNPAELSGIMVGYNKIVSPGRKG